MGAEEIKIQVGDGCPAPAVKLQPAEGEASLHSSPESTAKATTHAELVGAASATGAPASQDKINGKGSTGNEKCRVEAERRKDIEFGAVVAIFSFSVMLAGFFLIDPAGAKGRKKWRLDILMLLAFSSFICGFSFMLLSMQLLGAMEIHVSGCHRVISRFLFCACSVLLALTLLSLLVVMPFKPYVYVGVGVLALVAVPVAVVHCYASRRTEQGARGVEDPGSKEQKEAMEAAKLEEQLKEEMEASFKITSAVAASSFAGLVGMLFGVYKQAGGGSGATTPDAVHVAIMFMFSTAVVSMLLMMLSMKVLELNNQDLRRFIVRAIRCANYTLLCWLAVAALSAAFVILRFYIVAAFVSLGVAGTVHLTIQYCTAAAQVKAAGDRQGGQEGNENANSNDSQEMQLKWTADISSKVTSYSLGGVMAIFGGLLGDADNSHDKMVAIKVCMFLLTSAFASGLGLMLLTTQSRGGSGDRAGFKAATTILAWSAMGLLAAAALAIYGVEVMKS